MHPAFKLDWLDEDEKETALRFLQDAVKVYQTTDQPLCTEDQDIKLGHEGFFNFKRTIKMSSRTDELNNYLNSSSTSLESLNSFPIRTLFIKYNTSLPSSASVERLFSIGGLVLSPLKGRLHDDTFEQQLLLKINSAYIKH